MKERIDERKLANVLPHEYADKFPDDVPALLQAMARSVKPRQLRHDAIEIEEEYSDSDDDADGDAGHVQPDDFKAGHSPAPGAGAANNSLPAATGAVNPAPAAGAADRVPAPGSAQSQFEVARTKVLREYRARKKARAKAVPRAVRQAVRTEAKRWRWNDKKLETIQTEIDAIKVPAGFGRVIGNFSSKASGFTAAELRNVTRVYGPLLFQKHLHPDDFKIWSAFVEGAHRLCARSVTLESVRAAEIALAEFAHRFELRYDDEASKLNHHLVQHLGECVRDYGPVTQFWTFAYERMNGFLKHFQTNNKTSHLTMFDKMLRQCSLLDLSDVGKSIGPDGKAVLAKITGSPAHARSDLKV